jgi:hypothetical protein
VAADAGAQTEPLGDGQLRCQRMPHNAAAPRPADGVDEVVLRWTRCAVVLLLPACFHPVYDRPRCGPDGECPSGLRCSAELVCESGSIADPQDGSIGNPGDASTGAGCGFASLINTCLLSFDADLPMMGTAVYDTNTHVLMINGAAFPVASKTVMIGADLVDVISARDVHLGVSTLLRAIGSHGLAIIASHDVIVDQDALIDVSNGGAGARTSCPNGATRGADNGNGAGGGGGGGFGSTGGAGGAGNRDGAPSPGGSAGAAEPGFPAGFHGGCPGAPGGTGDLLGGGGGRGGGALYLVAGNSIVLSDLFPIDAGGGGGQGGNHAGSSGDAGGGGGGSGGLLILEAPHIMASTATIAANGGAGGEGSDAIGIGANGDPATRTTERASGGAGGTQNGSDGGDGGSAQGPGGGSVTDTAVRGGGGGGGSVGFIRVRSPDALFLALSPTAS